MAKAGKLGSSWAKVGAWSNSSQLDPTRANSSQVGGQTIPNSIEVVSLARIGLGWEGTVFGVCDRSNILRPNLQNASVENYGGCQKEVDSPLLLWFVSLTGAKGKGYGSFQEEAIRIFNSLKEQESMADPIPVIQVKPRPNARNMLRATLGPFIRGNINRGLHNPRLLLAANCSYKRHKKLVRGLRKPRTSFLCKPCSYKWLSSRLK